MPPGGDHDANAQGDPETLVCLPNGETIVGLHIRGLVAHVMLGVRTDRAGVPLTCAVVTNLFIDTSHRQDRFP